MFYDHPVIGVKFTLNSTELFNCWHMILGHIYPKYMEPLTAEITDSVQHVFTSSRSMLIIVSTILLILGILLSLYYVFQLCQEEKELKQILLLLLHAPPQEIIESAYIMAIISGDFSSREETGNNLDDNVFKSITENYPDGLILINHGTSAISFTNSKADEFLTTMKCEEEEEEKTNKKQKTKNKNKNKITTEKVIPKEIVLGQSHFTLNGRALIAKYAKMDATRTLVTLTDDSSIQKLEVELDKETKRKADLISQFMPPILTPKFMNNQDQGVSFSVPSVPIAMISGG